MTFNYDDELDLRDMSDTQLLASITNAREDERLPSEGEIKKLLAILAVAYPPPKIGMDMARRRVDLYCRMLADIPARSLAKKIENAIKSCTFFPTTAEIREDQTGICAAVDRMHHERRVEAIKAEARRRGWSLDEQNDPTRKLSNRKA